MYTVTAWSTFSPAGYTSPDIGMQQLSHQFWKTICLSITLKCRVDTTGHALPVLSLDSWSSFDCLATSSFPPFIHLKKSLVF